MAGNVKEEHYKIVYDTGGVIKPKGEEQEVMRDNQLRKPTPGAMYNKGGDTEKYQEGGKVDEKDERYFKPDPRFEETTAEKDVMDKVKQANLSERDVMDTDDGSVEVPVEQRDYVGDADKKIKERREKAIESMGLGNINYLQQDDSTNYVSSSKLNEQIDDWLNSLKSQKYYQKLTKKGYSEKRIKEIMNGYRDGRDYYAATSRKVEKPVGVSDLDRKIIDIEEEDLMFREAGDSDSYVGEEYNRSNLLAKLYDIKEHVDKINEEGGRQDLSLGRLVTGRGSSSTYNNKFIAFINELSRSLVSDSPENLEIQNNTWRDKGGTIKTNLMEIMGKGEEGLVEVRNEVGAILRAFGLSETGNAEDVNTVFNAIRSGKVDDFIEHSGFGRYRLKEGVDKKDAQKSLNIAQANQKKPKPKSEKKDDKKKKTAKKRFGGQIGYSYKNQKYQKPTGSNYAVSNRASHGESFSKKITGMGE